MSRQRQLLLSIFFLFGLSGVINAETFDETLRAAQQGEAVAQARLGWMYANGDGVPENYTEAAKWFRLAAEQGDALAQFFLGVMYDNGDGVPENDTEAVRWYRLAAEQGEAMAQKNLGVMYAKGEGIPENNIKGYVWFSLAKANGDEGAKEAVEIIKSLMTAEQIAAGQEIAAKCFESNYKDCD